MERLTPIGQYRWQWAGVEAGYGEPLYATAPYYAERECEQPCGITWVRRSKHAVAEVRQVLVETIGGYAWIAVRSCDLIRDVDRR